MKKPLDFLWLTVLRRIEIRYRLIISFFLVSLLPLLIAGLIAYHESSNASQEKVRIFAGEVVKQVAQNMRQQIEKIEASSEELVMSDAMQVSLHTYYSDNLVALATARTTITRLLLENYGAFKYVNQKYVLDRQYKILDSQVFAQLGGDVARFAANAPDRQGLPYWTIYCGAVGQRSIVMLRDVISKGNNRRIGTLFIGLQPGYFSRVFDTANLGYGSRMLLIDSVDGRIVAYGNRTSPDDAAIAAGLAAAITRGESDFISYADSQGKERLAAFAAVPHTSWVVANITPLDVLNAEERSVRNKIMLIGVLCFVISLMLSLIIARSISRPLGQLVGVMKTAASGNTPIRADHAGKDEITVLSQRFNEMAATLLQHREQLEERVAERTRELEKANRALETLSATDSLTGIANRRRFDTALDAELRRAVRSQRSLALLMLDVDYFKHYNDHYGHLAGDDCLRAIGQVLKTETRRSTDLAARYGGEEFAVIVADSDLHQARQLAQSIRAAIVARQIPHEASPFGCVTCSIGVVTLRIDDGVQAETIMQMADIALYQAKSAGRNRVAVFAPPDPAGVPPI